MHVSKFECKKCGAKFEVSWVRKGKKWVFESEPRCPECGSTDVRIQRQE